MLQWLVFAPGIKSRLHGTLHKTLRGMLSLNISLSLNPSASLTRPLLSPPLWALLTVLKCAQMCTFSAQMCQVMILPGLFRSCPPPYSPHLTLCQNSFTLLRSQPKWDIVQKAPLIILPAWARASPRALDRPCIHAQHLGLIVVLWPPVSLLCIS